MASNSGAAFDEKGCVLDDFQRIPFGVALRYEDTAIGEPLSLDRIWAVGAVAKTRVWASDALAGAEPPKQA